MRAVAAFAAGVAVTGGVAALVLASRASDDVARRAEVTGLRAQVATLQRDLDAARQRVGALEADLDAAARALRTAKAAITPPGEPAVAPAGEPAVAAEPPAVQAPREPAAPALPATQREWEGIVANALEDGLEPRLGRRLTAAQKARLVATLAAVRDASRRLQDAPLDPADPASVREHRTQEAALLAADHAFRDETGMGVAAFVQALSADKIEEAFPPDASR